MTLAELITALEAADPDRVVPHGFTNPHSYRGYYDELAFEPAANVTVADMLDDARSALGSTYEGWKGGDFTMRGHTDCWLSEEGRASGDTISALLLQLMLAEPPPAATEAPPATSSPMSQPEPLTEQQLDEYAACVAVYQRHPSIGFACCTAHPVADAGAALLAEVRRLRDRVAELEGPAVEARAALASLCYDLEDPGSAALGALYLISRATTGVEAPRDEAAQVLASHEAQVMRRCAEFVRDTYDGQWADDAAATLERDADVTEHGCPGYEDAGWGDTVAERQLANCKHCGRPRAVCVAAPAPSTAALAACQPSEAPVEPGTATRPPTGRTGDSRRTLTPNEYDAAWHAVEGAAGDDGADPGTVLHAVLNRLGIEWQDAARPATGGQPQPAV